MKKLVARILAGLALLLSTGLTATHAADISFSVNLQYQIQQGRFTVGTDQVVVLGSFSASGVALNDPDGDRIYSGTVTGQAADAQITYNYRFTHSGATVSETVAARKYVVQPTTAANVLTDWFNEQPPPYPYARFFASTVKTIPGEVVRFNDSSEGGAATSWSWTFQGGNPATSTAQNPTATWSAAGTYTVSLTASNASGNTTAKTLTVTVTSVDNALGWWNDAVFYQIYPRSFFDTNGNGFGDLQGMTSKLDYLNDGNAATTSDLGVTALYIMPVHDASEPYFGGYQVRDYKSIIGEIGTQADFDQFVAAAHQRGMKVILDMVFNHSSDEHPWFKSAAQGAGGKYDDYYVFRATNPGSAWRNNNIPHSNANFNVYWGKYADKTPDLNFNSRSVRNTVKDISSFWLGKNVDGFRLDAPMFLYERGDAINLSDQRSLPATYGYWREWRNHIKAANPNSFSVGETWLFNPVGGPKPSTAVEASKYVYQGFDVGFQFDIAYGVQYALNNENKSFLQTPVEESMNYYPFLQFGTFFSNHDLYTDETYKALRLKSRLTNNQDAKAKVAAAWLLTAPGVPFVYYGDEVGGGGNNNYARDPMRWTNGTHGGFTTGNPWEPAGDYAAYNVQSQQGVAGSFLSLYKQLIAIRKKEVSLRRGGYKSLGTSTNGVYAYMRTYGSEVTFVILNLSSTTQSNVALSASGTSIANGTFGLTNLLNSAQTASSVTVSGGSFSGWVPFGTLQPNAFAILKLGSGTTTSNRAPVANAGPDQSLAAGTTSATLTAAASSDPDGNALTYSWTKVSGPAATLSSTTSATPTLSGLTNGSTYVLQVSVSDGSLSSTDQVQVSVGAATTGATAYYIINRWKGTYLYDDNQQVKYGAANTGTAYRWTLEDVGGNKRIRNVASGRYMNIEGQLAYVESTSVSESFTSGQWVLEPYSGYTRIRNAWKGTYVNVENQTGLAQCWAVDATFYSGHWTLQTVTQARGTLATASSPAARLTIFPNPSHGALTLQLPGAATTARLRLLDGQGRVVLDRAATLTNGQTGLDVRGFAAGLYLLQATTPGGVYTGKVAIE